MFREVWPRRSIRILLLVVTVLLLLQYFINFFGYYREIPRIIWRKGEELGFLPGYATDSSISVVYDSGAVNSSVVVTNSERTIFDTGQSLSVKPKCPPFPPKLLGLVPVSKKTIEIEAVNALYAQYFKRGGFYSPSDCTPSQKGQ